MNKKSILTSSALFGLVFLFTAKASQAVCPVCTVLVGVLTVVSDKLGIDQSITGVWIGGLTLSLSLWTINWLTKKKWTFKFFQPVTIIGFYALTFLSLYISEDIFAEGGNPTLWGINKIILGMIFGTAGFYGGNKLYEYLKKQNNGKAHFPYEKVVVPVTSLLLLSLLFFLLTK